MGASEGTQQQCQKPLRLCFIIVRSKRTWKAHKIRGNPKSIRNGLSMFIFMRKALVCTTPAFERHSIHSEEAVSINYATPFFDIAQILLMSDDYITDYPKKKNNGLSFHPSPKCFPISTRFSVAFPLDEASSPPTLHGG